LVLLAPAFGFHRLWTDELGPKRLDVWRKTGSMPIFHYGEAREMPLGYQLMADAEKFEPFPDFAQPALIIHGNHDPLVPIAQSLRFAETHPNVSVVPLESGHELTDVLDRVWAETQHFLLNRGLDFEC
jgi:pimeloyl-ACP methyl ester carboxylesterase